MAAAAAVMAATAMETATAMEMVTVAVTTLTPTPSALLLKHFLLCHLLSLRRVLIYSSSCCTFLLPTLAAPSAHQHDSIAPAIVAQMPRCQSLQDTDVDVGVKCFPFLH
jgi:hypothetical protein